jgi:hypothetical protein
MGSAGTVVAIVVSVLCCLVVLRFFQVYGAFHHPRIAVALMLLSAAIPVIMVVGILPYDISLALFGSSHEDHKVLGTALNALYWLSFLLTWAVVPTIVSFLRYNHTISLRHRIWLTIREYLIFYGVALGIVLIAVVSLLATKRLTWDTLFPLAISLANGYGLLVLCLLLGHAFVSLPRTLWQMSTPNNRYLYHLHRIAVETSLVATTVADGNCAQLHCTEARIHLTDKLLRDKYMILGEPRRNRLEELAGGVRIPRQFHTSTASNPAFEQFRKLHWPDCKHSELEDFFSLLDDTITRMEEAAAIIDDSCENALTAHKQYREGDACRSSFQKVAAVAVVLVNVICIWGELCLMFDKKLSLFYQISHVTMPDVVDILLVSTPILAYLLAIGSWSLTHLRLGSFFRFTKNATNANTLNYFAVILCRLGPTIAFHYLQQIEAVNSEFQQVMGVMDQIVFIGNQWNIYSPILLILSMAFFAFSVPDKIATCWGAEGFTFDYSLVNYNNLAIGEEFLKQLKGDDAALIVAGNNYQAIMGQGMVPVGSSRSHLKDPLDVSLNSQA